MAPRDPPPSDRSSTSEPALAPLVILAWLAAVGGYWIWYYLQTIPIARPNAGHYQRGELLAFLILPEKLVGEWFGQSPLWMLVDRLPILAGAAIITLVAWRLGATTLSCLLPRRLPRYRQQGDVAERAILAIAIGWTWITLATLAVGCGGGLRNSAWFIGLAIVAVALQLVAFTRRRPSAAPEVASTPEAWTWLERLLLTASLAFASIIALGGMLPPCDFDVREYHLQAPKEFYQSGRITLLAHNVYANMPLAAELPTAAAMSVTGDTRLGGQIGKTLLAWFAIWTALALYAAGCRFGNRTIGLAAAALDLSTPWIYHVATIGLNEQAVGFFGFLAWYAAVRGEAICVGSLPVVSNPRPRAAGGEGGPQGRVRGPRDGEADRTAACRPAVVDDETASPAVAWLALSGFFAGSALGCKYPAALFVVAPLGVIVAYHALATRRFAGLIFFALAAALAGGPWLVKNAILTGNPCYPLLGDWFKTATRTAAQIAQWRQAHAPPGFAPLDFVRCAIDFLGRSPWQSHLLWCFVPWAWLCRARRPLSNRLALWIALTFVAWWLATHRVDRFWVPVLPWLSLLAAIGVANLAAIRPRAVVFGVLVAGFVTAFVFITIVGGRYHHNRYFASLDELWYDPARFEPWQQMLADLDPPVQTVLFIGDAEVYDVEVPVLYNTVFDRSIWETLARDRSPDEIRDRLRAAGISHLYVSWYWIDRYRQPGNYGYTDFVRREHFDALVQAGVLEPLPPPPVTGRPHDALYRVVSN